MNKIIHILRRLFHKQARAFTLIEISIVLIIVGLITAAVFKGKDLIEAARLQATVSEINRYRLAVQLYRDQFAAWPGNDALAQSHFGGHGVVNGDGTGVISEKEAEQFWLHLARAQLIASSQPPMAKIGGFFSVVAHPQEFIGNWLMLSASPLRVVSLLTPSQALQLKKKMGEDDPLSGDVIIVEGEGAREACLNDGTYNLKNSHPSCVVLIRL